MKVKMPVAGVASARARLFEEGFGGMQLEDDDYAEQAKVPGVVIKLRSKPTVKVARVPLPERFRMNGHQRHCKSLKKEINGEIVELGEEATVEGKPRERVSRFTTPTPLAAGAQRMAGAPTHPVEARQEKGAIISDNGVCMGVPARTINPRGPFHQYLSDSLAKQVTGIYYKVRSELPTHLELSRTSRNSARSSKSSGSGAGGAGTVDGMTHMEKLEEGPDGINNYPFVAGMQLFVDIEGEDNEGPTTPAKKSSCAFM